MRALFARGGAVLRRLIAGHTVAEFEVFFSSEYLRVVGPFLCFIIVRYFDYIVSQ